MTNPEEVVVTGHRAPKLPGADFTPLTCAAWGSLFAIVGAFPAAALTALVYRFPIPFAEYYSGIEGAVYSLFAVPFYGLLDGFPLLASLGAFSGFIAYAVARHKDRESAYKTTMAIALLFDFACAIYLAVLEKIIGPW